MGAYTAGYSKAGAGLLLCMQVQNWAGPFVLLEEREERA